MTNTTNTSPGGSHHAGPGHWQADQCPVSTATWHKHVVIPASRTINASRSTTSRGGKIVGRIAINDDALSYAERSIRSVGKPSTCGPVSRKLRPIIYHHQQAIRSYVYTYRGYPNHPNQPESTNQARAEKGRRLGIRWQKRQRKSGPEKGRKKGRHYTPMRSHKFTSVAIGGSEHHDPLGME